MANEAIAKPACDLADAGDNITKIVLKVTAALDDAGQKTEGSAFWHAAMRLKRPELVVELARAYVEVQSGEGPVATRPTA
jgi:hypothetical protein